MGVILVTILLFIISSRIVSAIQHLCMKLIGASAMFFNGLTHFIASAVLTILLFSILY